MRLLSLRWVFLLAAAAGAARCVFSGAAPGRVAFAAACGLAWLRLSRLKVRSLDRETLGVPPRR
ncbi:MAG TPA: hypothetical protein VH309_13695 [Elusimicrobiota bacterium]|jgi:hypothetical protein|nr:hypothetical protein [Elusimicrobiota bacterium]